MPTESELRKQLHAQDGAAPGIGGGAGIDLDAVLSAARRRRRPRVIVTTAVASLAVVGILVPVVIGVAGSQNGTFGSTSAGSADSAGSAGSAASEPGSKSNLIAPESGAGAADGGVGVAPADKLNLCGGGLASIAPASNGLELTVQPVDAAAGDRDIPATVTLTNTGTAAIHGSASPFPALTLSRDGIVLWHSNGAVPSLAQVIDLAPGASVTFTTSFEPLVCGVEDDSRSSFREDLPEAGPGSYGLSAAMDVSDDAGGSVRVTGPLATVTLH